LTAPLFLLLLPVIDFPIEVIMGEALNGAVLVVGGGIAGMQSALDLADSGYYVYLLEKSPAIGGAMAKLDKTFPTNDCAM
jgi:heterodisulfide reductase subunit A-like polyferredoxin